MEGASSTAFDRLNPAVQRWIWREQWHELRDVQEEAVAPILDERDVLISSATASGKTEAAFLPICSALAESAAEFLGVIYIAPLKALINDQHRRLEPLFECIKAPVTPWHGDIAGNVKRRLVEQPKGALLITPESLEALFVTHGSAMPRLVEGLRYIVVDELHAFIGTERGRQLQSLMAQARRGGEETPSPSCALCHARRPRFSPPSSSGRVRAGRSSELRHQH